MFSWYNVDCVHHCSLAFQHANIEHECLCQQLLRHFTQIQKCEPRGESQLITKVFQVQSFETMNVSFQSI